MRLNLSPASSELAGLMKRLVLIACLLILLWARKGNYGSSQTILELETPSIAEEIDVDDSQDLHQRQTEAIRDFLRQNNSPFVSLADTFVRVGADYDLDPYLLVAISGVESSFGKHYPVATNNPFGIYSGSGGLMYFDSLDSATEYLGKLLFEKYDTTSIENIGRKYCPPHYESWAKKVRFFQEEIKKLE